MNTGIEKLDLRSQAKLVGVHSRLADVILMAAKQTRVRFIITEGMRTAARQAELFRAGASQRDGVKKLSTHQLGRAVDAAVLVGAEVRWDWPLYQKLAAEVKAAAIDLGVPIVWGGDWKKFRDGPHFELGASVA